MRYTYLENLYCRWDDVPPILLNRPQEATYEFEARTDDVDNPLIAATVAVLLRPGYRLRRSVNGVLSIRGELQVTRDMAPGEHEKRFRGEPYIKGPAVRDPEWVPSNRAEMERVLRGESA